MLQRIQTLYLAGAALAILLFFFFPLANFYHELEGNYRFYLYGVRSMDPEPKVAFSAWFTLPVIVLAAASLILSAATIFLYRNRLLQIRLCAFNGLSNLVTIMVIFFFYAPKIKAMTLIEPAYNFVGMAMPLAALVLIILANRAIKKDEVLVRSADRLR